MERANSFDRLRQGGTQPLSLGQYRLLDELGRGGMGRVYRALHTIMGREVALKVISPELVADPIALAWFLREVRASTQLNHPNIVMAYDANEAEGQYFLVMEYVQGMTLDALVKQQGPLPIAYACALMRQAALGLQHAHEKGMVHRDIKPSNLLIPLPSTPLVGEGWRRGNDVLVKILDFGLARLHGKTKGDTIALRGEAGVLGTPDYIAPEQSRDIHAADIRSDLYSLGCVFYFTLTGSVPFPGDNAMEKLIKHLTEHPEPLEKVRAAIPPQVAAIVRRLMAKDPAGRYQTPEAFAHELEKELEKVAGTFSEELEKVAGTFSENLTETIATPSSQPDPDSEVQHTCVLQNVAVFAPTPSLTGETEESIAEAIGESAAPLAPSLSRRLVSDNTFREMALPDKTAAPTIQAFDSEPLPPIDPLVFRLWRRWLSLLDTIIAGRGSTRINSDTYQTTHTLLLQACRAAIDACPISERRAFYEECLSIAQPWLKLQSFVHADSSMLDSLLRRCRTIEVELNNGKAIWTLRQAVALLSLTLSPFAAALWYWCYGRIWLPSLLKKFQGDFSASSLSAAWSFLLTHPALLMGVLFPLVIIFSVLLLSRTPRS